MFLYSERQEKSNTRFQIIQKRQEKQKMKQANIIAACACGGTGCLIHTESGFYVKCEHAPHWYTPPVYHTERKAIHSWNEMQQNMDDLARDAMVADHRGISYGNYIPIKGQLPPRPAPKEPVYPPQGKRKYCAICGGEIPQGTNRRMYCSGSCADIATNKQRDQYKSRQRKDKK